MERTLGLLSMDVHRFLRAFIPGLISILAFLPFYCIVQKENIILDYIEEVIVKGEGGGGVVFGAVLVLILFVFIIGELLEWISHACLHRFCHWLSLCTIPLLRYKLLSKEAEELRRIFEGKTEEEKLEEGLIEKCKSICKSIWRKLKEEPKEKCESKVGKGIFKIFANYLMEYLKEKVKSLLNTTHRRKLVTIYDYCLHMKENETYKDRVIFMYSRIHSIHASMFGIFIAIIIFVIWCWFFVGCITATQERLLILILRIELTIFAVLYSFYTITRDNAITFEKVFIRNNKKELWEIYKERSKQRKI